MVSEQLTGERKGWGINVSLLWEYKFPGKNVGQFTNQNWDLLGNPRKWKENGKNGNKLTFQTDFHFQWYKL